MQARGSHSRLGFAHRAQGGSAWHCKLPPPNVKPMFRNVRCHSKVAIAFGEDSDGDNLPSSDEQDRVKVKATSKKVIVKMKMVKAMKKESDEG